MSVRYIGNSQVSDGVNGDEGLTNSVLGLADRGIETSDQITSNLNDIKTNFSTIVAGEPSS